MLPLTLLTLTLSALLATLTTALPYATSPYSPQNCQSTITKNGGVFCCNGYNYMGNCRWRAYPTTPGSEWCYSFGNVEERPRSIGPDPSGWCELFKEEGCRGEAVEIWKGIGDKRLKCPGISDSGTPEWWVSMKCRLK
ncbi:hypothetical protein IG631_22278 [Alternaria alternata]|nr:hypothetical protein IG631_22278 [Alternaria alternata]